MSMDLAARAATVSAFAPADVEGPAFSAGHDLRELRDRDVAAYREIFDVCVELMETIQRIPQPVIAEVATIASVKKRASQATQPDSGPGLACSGRRR